MSKTTLHPASQNLRVDIREECDNPGTMWASVTVSGSHGMSRLHVCVDFIVLPFGSVMVIGLVAFCILVAGAPSIRKCAVAPESDRA